MCVSIRRLSLKGGGSAWHYKQYSDDEAWQAVSDLHGYEGRSLCTQECNCSVGLSSQFSDCRAGRDKTSSRVINSMRHRLCNSNWHKILPRRSPSRYRHRRECATPNNCRNSESAFLEPTSRSCQPLSSGVTWSVWEHILSRPTRWREG